MLFGVSLPFITPKLNAMSHNLFISTFLCIYIMQTYCPSVYQKYSYSDTSGRLSLAFALPNFRYFLRCSLLGFTLLLLVLLLLGSKCPYTYCPMLDCKATWGATPRPQLSFNVSLLDHRRGKIPTPMNFTACPGFNKQRFFYVLL